MCKKLLLSLLITALLFSSGCWNRRELNQLALVLGTGVDQGQDGQVKITVQIAKPALLSVAAAGGQGGGGGQEKAVVVQSSQGKTVFDAVRNFVSITGRKLFFSHSQLIIFGEEQAKIGIGPVLDFFERDHEPRARAFVLVAGGEAGNILSIPGILEKASAMEITHAIESSFSLSKAADVTLHDFMQVYSSKATSAVAPRIELFKSEGEERFRITGMAVFKLDQLAGWLNETATRGLLWTQGKVRSGTVVIKVPGSDKGEGSIEITKSQSSMKPQLLEGRSAMVVEIKVEGNIGELTVPVDLSAPGMFASMEKSLTEAVTKEVEAALTFAQEHQADIFGFGEAIHRKFPQEWAQLKDRWDEEFPVLEVAVTVQSKIRRIGDKTMSTAPK